MPGRSGNRTEAPTLSRTAPPLCRKGRARVTTEAEGASTVVMHGGATPEEDGIAVEMAGGERRHGTGLWSPLTSVAIYGQLEDFAPMHGV